MREVLLHAEIPSLVLVTGGTGTLGRLVVKRLLDAGCAVRVLSRQSRESRSGVEFVSGNLDMGEGVAAAVAGVDVIVHCAGSRYGDERKTATLVRAVKRAGAAPHLVNVSVVGADRIPIVGNLDQLMFGYFGSKLAAERVVAESGLPWTTLRATQFHEFMFTIARQMARLPVIPAPVGIRFQPIDAGEVADRVVALAMAMPSGLVGEIAGPKIYSTTSLLRGYLNAIHKHRLIVPVWLPGNAAQAMREGANLAPDRALGIRTWEAFLEEHAATADEGRSAEAVSVS